MIDTRPGRGSIVEGGRCGQVASSKAMELIPWLVAVYALICMAAYFGNRLFTYFPDPTRVAPGEAGSAPFKIMQGKSCSKLNTLHAGPPACLQCIVKAAARTSRVRAAPQLAFNPHAFGVIEALRGQVMRTLNDLQSLFLPWLAEGLGRAGEVRRSSLPPAST